MSRFKDVSNSHQACFVEDVSLSPYFDICTFYGSKRIVHVSCSKYNRKRTLIETIEYYEVFMVFQGFLILCSIFIGTNLKSIKSSKAMNFSPGYEYFFQNPKKQ